MMPLEKSSKQQLEMNNIQSILGIAGLPGILGNPGAPGIPGKDGCNGTDGKIILKKLVFWQKISVNLKIFKSQQKNDN